jgi:hypothetical protein
VFHAAALCTLQVKDDRFFFDADEFLNISLEEVDPDGHA